MITNTMTRLPRKKDIDTYERRVKTLNWYRKVYHHALSGFGIDSLDQKRQRVGGKDKRTWIYSPSL
jgi:hypothetical protein